MRLTRPFVPLVTGLVMAATVMLSPSALGAVPGTPSAPSASGERDALEVRWTAPSDGGSPITGYTATAYATAGGNDPVSGCSTTSVTSTVCLVDGLTSGTTYYVSVVARNADGTGSESSRTSAIAGSVPSAPRTVTYSRTPDLLSIAWTAPSDNGGSAITSYSAFAYTSTSSTAAPVASCTTSGLDCSITGLTSSVTYYFAVSASNAVGQGAKSTRQAAYVADVPGAPLLVKATAGNGFAKVTWSAPASSGNSRITRYEVRAWTSATAGTLVATCSPTVFPPLACDLGPLPNGRSYYVDAVATNGLGTGPASSPRSEVFTATTPGTPPAVQATRVGSGIRVSWGVPASDGGYPISQYVATAYSALTGGAVVGSCTSSAVSYTHLTLPTTPYV